jgi:hypothetical protein
VAIFNRLREAVENLLESDPTLSSKYQPTTPRRSATPIERQTGNPIRIAQTGESDEHLPRVQSHNVRIRRWWGISAAAFLLCLIIVSLFIWSNQKKLSTQQGDIPRAGIASNNVELKLLNGQQTIALNEVSIHLMSTQYDGSLQNYKVTAFISSAGYKALEIHEQAATNENSYFYADNRYRIKVVSADEESATFQVSRLKN